MGMTNEEREIALYCLKASSDYHSEVCEECVKYPNCDHMIQDDVTETIIKALEQQQSEDCISRAEVIDIINFEDEWLFDANSHNADTKIAFSTIKSKISEMPSVTPQQTRWIPVTERLPEDGRTVLVWYEYFRYGDYNKLFQTYGLSYAYGGHWSEFVNGESGWKDLRIIAWMPLPQPYAESEELNEHQPD